MRKHIPLKNAYQHASIAVHQSQTIIEDEPTSTATESPMHSLWQIFNVPFLTQNSSIHKKEDDDSSVDETFWFDVLVCLKSQKGLSYRKKRSIIKLTYMKVNME